MSIFSILVSVLTLHNAISFVTQRTIWTSSTTRWSCPYDSENTMIPKTEKTRATLDASTAISATIFTAALMASSRVVNAEEPLSRADVGFIDLNQTEPKITDVAWLDIQIGDSPPQRIEVSLYGEITPITVANFKSLCSNTGGIGYKDSDIFRIISSFSVQGGNIITQADSEKNGGKANIPQSTIGR